MLQAADVVSISVLECPYANPLSNCISKNIFWIYTRPQKEALFYTHYLSQYKTRLRPAVEYSAVWHKTGQNILMPEQAINWD